MEAARDIVAWAEENFFIPDASRNRGRRVPGPIRLLPRQKRILRHCFTKDAEGRFPYDTIVFSTRKKHGKTTIGALVGQWFARTQEAPNEIYVVANDMEQAQSRVFKALRYSIAKNSEWAKECRVSDEGATLPNGTTIVPIPTHYASAAGSNHGLVLFDEMWAYVSEHFVRLYDELTQVPTRVNSIHFITTYAGFEGQGVLWDLYRQNVGPEEHPDGQGEKIEELSDLPCWRNGRTFIYWDHENYAPWITEAYLSDQKKRLRPSAFLRFHGNYWVTSEEQFIDPTLWDACVDKDLVPMLADAKVVVYGAVDASQKHDCTAVVFVYYDRVLKKVVLATHKIWKPTPEDPIDLEETVEAYLLEIAKRFRIGKVRADPFQMHRSITTLKKTKMRIEEWPQTEPNLTATSQQLFDLLQRKGLVLYPDEELRKQMLATVAVQKTRGWKIDKKKASSKIDGIAALATACHLAVEEGAYADALIEIKMPFPDLAGPLPAGLPLPLSQVPIPLGGWKPVEGEPSYDELWVMVDDPYRLEVVVNRRGAEVVQDKKGRFALTPDGYFRVRFQTPIFQKVTEAVALARGEIVT